jgi:hypothetical protein
MLWHEKNTLRQSYRQNRGDLPRSAWIFLVSDGFITRMLPYHRNNLLLVMLLHAAVNTWSGPLQISPEVAGSIRPFILVVILTWAAALLVVISIKGVRTQKATD